MAQLTIDVLRKHFCRRSRRHQTCQGRTTTLKTKNKWTCIVVHARSRFHANQSVSQSAKQSYAYLYNLRRRDHHHHHSHHYYYYLFPFGGNDVYVVVLSWMKIMLLQWCSSFLLSSVSQPNKRTTFGRLTSLLPTSVGVTPPKPLESLIYPNEHASVPAHLETSERTKILTKKQAWCVFFFLYCHNTPMAHVVLSSHE